MSSDIDLSGLTDDQLVGLAQLLAAEIGARSPAVQEAARGAIFEEAEAIRAERERAERAARKIGIISAGSWGIWTKWRVTAGTSAALADVLAAATRTASRANGPQPDPADPSSFFVVMNRRESRHFSDMIDQIERGVRR